MESFVVTEPAGLELVAESILAELASLPTDRATILTLSGTLGAGKTALVKVLAGKLGVVETVTSPTFIVLKLYETDNDRFQQLIHIDAYRLVSEEELLPLRFFELLAQPNTLVCIEWPEQIPQAIAAVTHGAVKITDTAGRRDITFDITYVH